MADIGGGGGGGLPGAITVSAAESCPAMYKSLGTTLYTHWEFWVLVAMEPPSYEEAILTGGCATLGSVSASSDIVHFLDIARDQTHHLNRIKAMFTATEALFWVMTSTIIVEILAPISHVLGAAAQYTYLYLQSYNIATQKEELDPRVTLQLQQFFDKWQSLILQYPFLYALSIDHPPLCHLTCDREKHNVIIRSVQDLGYATIELVLDRNYASVLYGARGARAGFPQSYEWTCPYREGKRRRQIHRLLNEAGIEAPDRHELPAVKRGWCVECRTIHLK